MKERAAELRAEGKKGAKKADGLQALLDKIAEMAPEDRALAERVHVTVTAAAPELAPKTWYGMPAYANADDKVVIFFQDSGKFGYRYSTLGFQDVGEPRRRRHVARVVRPHAVEPRRGSTGYRAREDRDLLSSAAGGDQLGDLRGVERRALAQVVAADEQLERVRVVQRRADPADPGRVGADDVGRRRELAGRRVVDAPRRRPRPRSSSRASSASGSPSKTRVHGERVRGDDRARARRSRTPRRSGSPRILRDSLRTLSSSLDQPPSCSEPAHGTTLSASGAGNGPRSSPTDRRARRRPGCPGSGRRRPWPAARAACRCRPDPAPDAAWYDATTSSRRPYARCSAPSATIIDSVVQFGLPMMPLGRVGRGGGVDLGHDERDVGVHPEGAGVVDRDGAARGGDRRPLRGDLVGDVEHRDVDAVEDLRRQRQRPRRPRRAPAAAGRPTAPTRPAGSRPRRRVAVESRSSMTVPTAPVAPTTASVGRDLRAPARSSPGPSVDDGLLASRRPGSNAECTAVTAASTSCLAAHDRDADLGRRDDLDVDAGVRERAEERRGDARVRAHARADQRDLADRVVVLRATRSRSRPCARRRAAMRPVAVGLGQGERDVGAVRRARPRRSARSCRC